MISTISVAKFCWLAAVLVVGLGYFVVIAPGEAQIADLNARVDGLLARVLADEQAAKDVDRLNKIQRDIGSELDGVSLATDRAVVMAAFLGDLESRSASRRVRLLSVQNQLGAAVATASRPAAGSVAGASDLFDAVSLDVVLQGRYTQVLQAIANLSQSHVLMKIQQSSMDRAKGEQDERSPVLSVQLKVALFYLRAALPIVHAAAT